MSRYMGSKFEMPAASIAVFGILMLLIWIPIYDLFVMRWLQKATGNERGITSLQRIGTGLFIAILSMVTAATVEIKRRNAAHKLGLLDRPDLTIPVSVFWLVPQHCLFGLAESFVFVGELEFFYDQSPESMRSTGTALFLRTFTGFSLFSVQSISCVSSCPPTGFGTRMKRCQNRTWRFLLTASRQERNQALHALHFLSLELDMRCSRPRAHHINTLLFSLCSSTGLRTRCTNPFLTESFLTSISSIF